MSSFRYVVVPDPPLYDMVCAAVAVEAALDGQVRILLAAPKGGGLECRGFMVPRPPIQGQPQPPDWTEIKPGGLTLGR